MKPTIVKLDNPIQHYAWGSRTAIARLQGRPAPSAKPEAELWIGDHPVAPSRVRRAEGDPPIPLADWLAAAPDATLGRERTRGDHLPFLTKILAAAQPLSLQVHPDDEQARAGFAREEAAGTAAEQRSYRDPYAKHEMMIALSPFHALCGLRPDEELRPLAARTGSAQLCALLDRAEKERDAEPEHERQSGSTASRLLAALHALEAPACRSLSAELAAGVGSSSTDEHDARYWIGRLCADHPEDALVAAPVLMNFVSLAPGEALVVAPGTLHTYLDGLGVEVMTTSDNVVRAGLSPKHIDVAEFQRIASTRAQAVEPVHPERSADDIEARYATGASDFSVSTLDLGGSRPMHTARGGGRVGVLLCVDGTIAVAAEGAPAIRLGCGEAAIVPAATERYVVETDSTARAFLVQAGELVRSGEPVQSGDRAPSL